MDSIVLRPATPEDSPEVAEIWCNGWRDGHLGGVPDELVAVRTPASFRSRAANRVADTTVATVNGAIAGFTMVAGDEVEQVYVAKQHRGTGIAARLLWEAEQRIVQAGHGTAWLVAVATNARARAFYAREGWKDEGPFVYQAQTETGPIAVPSHRYTKRLAASGGRSN